MKNKGRLLQFVGFIAAMIAYTLSASSYLHGNFATKYDLETRTGGIQKQLESIDKKLDIVIQKHMKQED